MHTQQATFRNPSKEIVNTRCIHPSLLLLEIENENRMLFALPATIELMIKKEISLRTLMLNETPYNESKLGKIMVPQTNFINSLIYYFPGKTALAELLIKCGVDIDIKDNAGWTALRAANFQDHTEFAQFLIENGADTLSLN